MPAARSRRLLRGLAAAGLAGVLSGALGWWTTDRLEQGNDFCNACHLEADVRLHAAQRRDFELRPAVSLVAAHGAARVPGRADAAFRCIDCHGGTGLLGRARVKLLAARDAALYVVGRFEEPEGMRWPLEDADCRRCHAVFAAASQASRADPAFHALPVHNHELGMGCVVCHLGHEPGVAGLHYLAPVQVRARCTQCHPELEEGMG